MLRPTRKPVKVQICTNYLGHRVYTEAALLTSVCDVSVPERSKPREGTPRPDLPPCRGFPTSAGRSGFGCSPGSGALSREPRAQQPPCDPRFTGPNPTSPLGEQTGCEISSTPAQGITRDTGGEASRPKAEGASPASPPRAHRPGAAGLGGQPRGERRCSEPPARSSALLAGGRARSGSHHTSPPPPLQLNSKPSAFRYLRLI